MTVIRHQRVSCHGKMKEVEIHKGKHGGEYYKKRKHGGGTRKVYL